MMQKKIAAGLAVLLAAGTILGGCGESGAAGNDSVSDAAAKESVKDDSEAFADAFATSERKQRRTDVTRKPSRTRWQK